MTATANFLTVHVLDTTTGRPAAGLSLVLNRIGEETSLADRRTNADGRCDTPLLADAAMTAGTYQIVFDIAAWREGADDPGFYDRIAIRFVIGASPGHVHIPLLLSPYGYSTYRGS